jgi:hypothetical protein
MTYSQSTAKTYSLILEAVRHSLISKGVDPSSSSIYTGACEQLRLYELSDNKAEAFDSLNDFIQVLIQAYLLPLE